MNSGGASSRVQDARAEDMDGTRTAETAHPESHPAVGDDSRVSPPPVPVGLWTRALWATRRVGRQVVGTATPIIVFMALWQGVALSGIMPKAFFPGFGAMFTAIAGEAADGILWTDIGSSLYRLIISVFVGAVIGTGIGLLMGAKKWAEVALVPLMNFGLATPGIALIPMAILWFGLTDLTIISILIYEVVLVTVLNTWTAVKSVDQRLIDAGRTMGCTGPEMFLRILLPGALAGMMAGYRMAFSRAWRILVAGEMLAGVAGGVGYRIFEAQQFFRADMVYGGILIIGIIGLLIERVVLRSLEMATIDRWGAVRELK